MKLLACVYVLAAFLIAESLQSTPFRKCKNGLPPTELRVKGCTSLPCPLRRGAPAVGEWDFTVTTNTKTLKPQVKATTRGVTVNYPLPQKNACKSLVGSECPLYKGEKATYSLSMPVSRLYPRVAVSIEFSLIDENDQAQVCFVLPTEVV